MSTVNADDRASSASSTDLARVATVRAFVVLLLAGFAGALAVLPYALALNPPQVPAGGPPLALLLGAGILQTLALLAISAALGLWLGPPVGLGAPLLVAWLTGDPAAPRRVRDLVPLAALGGAVTGLLLVFLDALVFAPNLPNEFAADRGPTAVTWWQGLLASLYGGIDEEILLRLGLMTVLVRLGTWLTRFTPPSALVYWVGNLLAAFLFGLGHVPATAALVTLTPLVVARALLLNSVAGVVFGYLYWRKGLLAAMLTHFSADVVLHVLAPVLFVFM